MMRFNPVRYLAVLPLILGLTQCDVIEAIHNPKPKDGPDADDLVLKTSPKAEAALKTSEGLTVDAYYYGHVKPAFSAEADSLHRIRLGRETWDYPATSRRVHLYAAGIESKALRKTIEGEPLVLVTVLGSGVPGKVVDCHSYIGPIRQAHQKSPEMHCEIESETYWEDATANASATDAAK
ncbi:MAG: hypothetical protein QM647_06000 [Asticcacaulis sp.]|uniref:hypothetical protein n=1 Tax=Asticcacaulis sp. TaxID=1872648 RepID=UPI0039E26F97